MAEESRLRTDAFAWQNAGETTTAYTAPDSATEWDYTNMLANHADAVFFTLDELRYNTMGFRFIVDDDGDDAVFEVYATKGKLDHFTRVMTLTVKGGTQPGPATSTATSGGKFCDTITKSNDLWLKTITIVDGGAADRMATIWLDIIGYDTWALVGTTVDDTTLVQTTGF